MMILPLASAGTKGRRPNLPPICVSLSRNLGRISSNQLARFLLSPNSPLHRMPFVSRNLAAAVSEGRSISASGARPELRSA